MVGRIAGVYGVRGWLRVESYTANREEILGFRAWHVRRGHGEDWRLVEVMGGRAQGAGVVAQLAGVADRDQARALLGCEIAIPREMLGEPGRNEYFWADLEGLRVVTTGGVELGKVSHLFVTGANDVMVVREDGQAGRERLIPFTSMVVRSVDLARGLITVEWDPDF